MKNFVLNSTCTFCDVRFILNKCREMLNNTSMNRNKLESCLNLEPMPIFTVRSCSRQQPWHSNSSGLVWLLSPNITSIFEILNYKRNKKNNQNMKMKRQAMKRRYSYANFYNKFLQVKSTF
jgi:hypothetical protein